jgi:hypothetical protein
VRELASELGVDVEPAGMAVIDHFSHDPADPSHATVVATNFVHSKAVFGGRSPVRFEQDTAVWLLVGFLLGCTPVI